MSSLIKSQVPKIDKWHTHRIVYTYILSVLQQGGHCLYDLATIGDLTGH